MARINSLTQRKKSVQESTVKIAKGFLQLPDRSRKRNIMLQLSLISTSKFRILESWSFYYAQQCDQPKQLLWQEFMNFTNCTFLWSAWPIVQSERGFHRPQRCAHWTTVRFAVFIELRFHGYKFVSTSFSATFGQDFPEATSYEVQGKQSLKIYRVTVLKLWIVTSLDFGLESHGLSGWNFTKMQVLNNPFTSADCKFLFSIVLFFYFCWYSWNSPIYGPLWCYEMSLETTQVKHAVCSWLIVIYYSHT